MNVEFLGSESSIPSPISISSGFTLLYIDFRDRNLIKQASIKFNKSYHKNKGSLIYLVSH